MEPWTVEVDRHALAQVIAHLDGYLEALLSGAREAAFKSRRQDPQQAAYWQRKSGALYARARMIRDRLTGLVPSLNPTHIDALCRSELDAFDRRSPCCCDVGVDRFCAWHGCPVCGLEGADPPCHVCGEDDGGQSGPVRGRGWC